MIPADGTYHVHYKPGSQGRVVRPVVAWDDQGTPLVVGQDGLVRAPELGFVKAVRRDNDLVVGAVPGGGWLIDCKDDEGNTWTSPILAWTIHADGSATALTVDADGLTSDATEGLAEYRIYHPSSTDVGGPPAE